MRPKFGIEQELKNEKSRVKSLVDKFEPNPTKTERLCKKGISDKIRFRLSKFEHVTEKAHPKPKLRLKTPQKTKLEPNTSLTQLKLRDCFGATQELKHKTETKIPKVYPSRPGKVKSDGLEERGGLDTPCPMINMVKQRVDMDDEIRK